MGFGGGGEEGVKAGRRWGREKKGRVRWEKNNTSSTQGILSNNLVQRGFSATWSI